jgi:hypothetical protein
MAKRGRKSDLTQEDILAWADNLAGIAPGVTAKKQGVSTEAIRRRRIKCAAFIAEKFDINEYRLPLYSLYSLWLNSVIHNLKKNDTTITMGFGKGMNLFVEKQEVLLPADGNREDTELIAEAQKIIAGTAE